MKPNPSTQQRFRYISNRINALIALLKEGDSAPLRRKLGYWSKELIKLAPQYPTPQQRRIVHRLAHTTYMASLGYGDMGRAKVPFIPFLQERSVA